MTVHVRPYAQADGGAVVEVHDAARLDEPRSSAGVEASAGGAADVPAGGP